jgi:hypothetical protein
MTTPTPLAPSLPDKARIELNRLSATLLRCVDPGGVRPAHGAHAADRGIMTEEEENDFIGDLVLWLQKRQLRKDRPWVYDIVRVILPRQSKGLRMQRIYQEVRDMRDPSGLPKPRAFEAIVRHMIYIHSKASPQWNGNAEDDLFISLQRGLWSTNVDRADAWIKRHESNIFLPGGKD